MNRRVVVLLVCLALAAAGVVAVLVTGHRFEDASARTPAGGTPVIAAPAPRSDEAAENFGWQRIGGDEFDGTTVDPVNWAIYNGHDAASNTTWSAKQCTVSNGVLTLTGAPDAAGTTCGMAWQQDRTYGRWEVRARFPAPASAAYDPVFLLWPQNDDKARVGEIDFAEEYDPNRQYIESWLHGPGNTQVDYQRKYVDLTQWHDFAVEWEPGHITCYLDGVPWVGYADPRFIPAKPMHLVLQQNFVPHTRADVPPARSTVEIDWVRIYRA
ncbi:MAG TPA: glycoside hydrolase family 16 protein [Amycolatopsis sp.]|nr:glycoside hydrolase family 16 protein [Amycolatopsis sp.]